MTEEDNFDDDPIEYLVSNGKVIGSQTWRNGSWSYVYEHEGKFYALDEAGLTECKSAELAFKRANFGGEQYDTVDSQFIDPEFRDLFK